MARSSRGRLARSSWKQQRLRPGECIRGARRQRRKRGGEAVVPVVRPASALSCSPDRERGPGVRGNHGEHGGRQGGDRRLCWHARAATRAASRGLRKGSCTWGWCRGTERFYLTRPNRLWSCTPLRYAHPSTTAAVDKHLTRSNSKTLRKRSARQLFPQPLTPVVVPGGRPS